MKDILKLCLFYESKIVLNIFRPCPYKCWTTYFCIYCIFIYCNFNINEFCLFWLWSHQPLWVSLSHSPQLKHQHQNLLLLLLLIVTLNKIPMKDERYIFLDFAWVLSDQKNQIVPLRNLLIPLLTHQYDMFGCELYFSTRRGLSCNYNSAM